MFQTDKNYLGDTLNRELSKLERNYKIQNNDYITFQIFTNKGERLIDPNFELRKTLVGIIPDNGVQKYLVLVDGTAKFPMIGFQYVKGLTINQLDSLLQQKYTQFYTDVYVLSRVVNKRVFVLGTAPAGSITASLGNGRVVPLENENMTLIEVLALSGGLDGLAKSHNIRLIRGDLSNPTVQIIDLSTIEGMRKASLLVQPNDIIYIERFQRRVQQALQEVSTVTSVIFGFLGFYLAINQFTR